jgi:hypothetical protein
VGAGHDVVNLVVLSNCGFWGATAVSSSRMQSQTQQPSTKPSLTPQQKAYQKALRNLLIKVLNYAKEISKPPS